MEMGHLYLECVAHPRINELELVGRVTWQQMSLAPVASQVCEMRLGGLAVEVVKDRNAFTASLSTYCMQLDYNNSSPCGST